MATLRRRGPADRALSRSAAEDFGAGGGEHEGLLGLGAGQGRVPGEGLTDGDLEGDAGGGDHLPGPVAGEAPLVVVAPAVGDAGPGVEAPAVVEHVAQRAPGAGGVPEPPVAARLGDVAVVAREAVAFADPADSGNYQLRCRHGSLTS